MALEHIHLWGSVAVPPWEHPVGVVPTWDWFPSRQGDAGHNSWSKYLFLSLCTKKKKNPLPCQKPNSATPVFKWWGEGLKPRTTGTCRLIRPLYPRDTEIQVWDRAAHSRCERIVSSSALYKLQRHKGYTAEKSLLSFPWQGRLSPYCFYGTFHSSICLPLITAQGGRGHCLSLCEGTSSAVGTVTLPVSLGPPSSLPLFAPPAEASHLKHRAVKRGSSAITDLKPALKTELFLLQL